MAEIEGLPKLNPAAEKLVRLRDVQRLSPSASCEWWAPMHATTVVALRLRVVGHTAMHMLPHFISDSDFTTPATTH
jgi:hypothetical protein